MSRGSHVPEATHYPIVAAKTIYEVALLGFSFEQMAQESQAKSEETRASLLQILELSQEEDDPDLDQKRDEAAARFAFFCNASGICKSSWPPPSSFRLFNIGQ